MRKELRFLKIILGVLASVLAQPINAQVLNSNIIYEVHFLQGYGFISEDAPGNDPEQTFQMAVSNDYNNVADTLLDHSSGGNNSGSYCYNMAVTTDIWGPEVDANLALIGGGPAGKFDFDIFSWEEDVVVGECQYTTTDDSPGFRVLLISTTDSVNACEWRTDTIAIPNIPNPSKARIKYTWRYENGRDSSPLNFGDLTSNGLKTSKNSNRYAPSGASNTSILGYHNDWDDADNAAFTNAPDVTYSFELTNNKKVIMSTISNFTNYDTYIHLVRLNPDGSFLSYISGNDDAYGTKSQLSEILCPGKYGIVVEGYNTSNGNFELGVTTSDAPKVYVKNNAVGLNDGTSWENAYNDLQDALSATNNCSTIWVAKGTYYPTSTADVNISFEIPDQVKMYGGFAGNEDSSYDLDLRDIEKNTTILSGDIDQDGLLSGNSYHVVKTTHVGVSTRVDGFRISDGNMTVFGFGAGWLNENGSPFIVNCFFYNNAAMSAGGGFANLNIDGSSSLNPTLINCKFIDNSASIGAGVYQRFETSTSPSQFYNCLIARNKSVYGGGGVSIECDNSTVQIEFINCTIADNRNTAENSNGGGIKTAGDAVLIIKNTVIKGNTIYEYGTASSSIYQYDVITASSISYSLVEYITMAGVNNNLAGSTEPKFAKDFHTEDAIKEGYRIVGCSPLINAGTSSGVYAIDFAGQPRTFGGFTDIGHFEYQGNLGSATRLYVTESGSGNRNGLSWANASKDLYWVQSTVFQCPNLDETWVAKGEYTSSQIDLFTRFAIKSGTKIYGGFSGAETALSQRNMALIHTTNLSTLSGDIGHDDFGGLDFEGFNSQDIFDMRDCNNQTVIDGFLFTNVDDSDSCSPIEISDSNPLISNCIFQNNKGYKGTGLSIYGNSNPLIDKCIFRGNQSSSDGGAIRIYSGTNNLSVKFTNCLISGNNNTSASNAAIIDMGSFENATANLTLENCIISSNNGDAVYLFAVKQSASTNLILKNTIIYGNSQGIVVDNTSNGTIAQNISYSLVQGLTSGTGNLDGNTVNPNFVSMPSFNAAPTINGDYHVSICSPVINQGNNTGITSFDLAHNARRFANQTVDMGVYEFQGIYANATLDLNGVNLSSGVGSPALFYSNQVLAANKVILNTKNTLYQAAHSIELNPGFKVDVGAIFQAKIETLTCP